MMRAALSVVLLPAAISIGAIPPSAEAFAGGCDSTGSLQAVETQCTYLPEEAHNAVQQTGGSSAVWTYELHCFERQCADPTRCTTTIDEREVKGYWYEVRRNSESLGFHCIADAEAEELPVAVVTPGMVQRAFERLSWPSSELVIQPPDGRTLVNFDTNFYTENAEPTSQQVTLLGQRVTIEATPVRYVWHFDESGTADDSLETESPGAPYPDLEVTHAYRNATDAQPRVDTVYAGRYRVGNQAWRDIPATLTVEGSPVPLEIVEATPHLVGTTQHR